VLLNVDGLRNTQQRTQGENVLHTLGKSNRSKWMSIGLRLVSSAALLATGLTASTPTLIQAASVANSALILSTSISPGSCDPTEAGGHCTPTTSLEEQQAQILGYTTTVVTAAQWGAMTAAQFATYQVLILGDPTCSGTNSFAAAQANMSVWEPVVMSSGGNKVIIGTDPTFHNQFGSGGAFHNGGEKLEKGGIGFAGAQTGATGAYVDLTCAYAGGSNTPVPILDGLSTAGAGQFFADGAPCAGAISIQAATGPTASLHDPDLSGWGCSVHESFRKWAPDYQVLASATDPSLPTHPFCANDIDTHALTCGEPYVLASGSGIVVTSEISLSPLTATNPVGGSHTVTATVLKAGTPESGKTVSFIVSAGPNVGKTGTGVTDASGHATFTYTDTGGAGTDTITGTFTADSGATESATATKVWTPGTADTTPPSCALTAVIAGPPKQLQITVQDSDGGLKSIVTTASSNATISIPAFTAGTTSPVVVTATKIDQTLGASVTLQATDMAGNVVTCDPEMVTVNGGVGRPVSKVVTGVAQAESTVSIFNNTPGVKQIDVKVNGKLFKVTRLHDGEARTIDIASALKAGTNNTVVLTARGSSGSAEVLITDMGKHTAAQHGTKHVVVDHEEQQDSAPLD
jgi:hypothetical protein